MSYLSSSPKIPSIISGATKFHSIGITGKNITICILDSGLGIHPDIPSHQILAFKDFISNKPFHYDDYSHGTHVTGIIASTKTGIAPDVNIISLKILDHLGNGSTDTFIEATKWILSNQSKYKIKIINISIGGNHSELKKEKNRLNLWVSKLWESGIIVCCSAGNNGPNPNSITAPGNCKKVITVGSYDGKNFSSVGPLQPYITKPELVAPGMHILSTKPDGGYRTKSGTSMSVPFISATCALLLQKNPDLSNNQIKSRLMKSADPISNLPHNMQGAGIVNLTKLLSNDTNFL